jgi:Holliday junction resolvase-like predicted endonuclease
MNLLIPYIHFYPPDPAFDEFTYGDVNRRARKLKFEVNQGDYIFFHTGKSGKKYITAYYVVDRVLDTAEAAQNQDIIRKYRNHHIAHYLEGKERKQFKDDVIVFGDPILSYILPRPLLFNRELAEKLSLKIKFSPGRSESQILGGATRAWRQLSEDDVEILKKGIGMLKEVQLNIKPLMSTEEVSETLEKDIEDYLAKHPDMIGSNLKYFDRQYHVESGRIDILFKDKDDKGNWVIVEVKQNRIGRDAYQQIKSYVHKMQKDKSGVRITAILVCSGIMPAFEKELREQTDIKIFVYGWELKIDKGNYLTT